MFKATYTYICVANFACTRSFFSYIYIRVHVLSLYRLPDRIYIYVYIHIFLRVEQTDPRHLIPLFPKPAHASSILLSLLSVPSDRAFNGCFVFTCVQSIYTYTCRRSPFRLLAQIKLRDGDFYPRARCDLDSAHASSM